MKLFKAILIFAFMSSAVASAQEVNVKAAFDTSRIFLGDQINYTITVDKPVGFILTVPVLKDTLQKNLEILKGPLTDTSFLKDGRIRIRNRYLVTSFDSGFYQVQPAYAEMITATGIKRFYSDYAALEVMRVKIAPADTTAKIFDIIKPYRAPVTLGEILPWVLIAAVAAALIWYVIRTIKRLRHKKSGKPVEIITEPAHIIAFRELEKLKEEKLWQKGEIKPYYSRLTEIVRQYLENRFRIYSLELTTPETLSELKKTGFRDDENFRRLKTILTGADLVKFAKYNPEASENELHFDLAGEFVKGTKIEEAVPSAAKDVETDKKEAV
jgi:hypothetical protein